MDYGFANYVTIPVVQAGEVVQAGVPVAKGSPATVDVVAARDLLVTIEKAGNKPLKRRWKWHLCVRRCGTIVWSALC